MISDTSIGTRCDGVPCICGRCSEYWTRIPAESGVMNEPDPMSPTAVRNRILDEAARVVWVAVMDAAKRMDHPNECALIADIAESVVQSLKALS